MMTPAETIETDLPEHDPVSTFATFAKAPSNHPPRILIFYGSLRPMSFSRYLAEECGRGARAMASAIHQFHRHQARARLSPPFPRRGV